MSLRPALPWFLLAILAGRVHAQVAAGRQAIAHAVPIPLLADAFDFPVG
ncbi:MAG: hypothetical protein H0X40_11600 [Chthoniobacterales bacterium]|nr:hypothetical protein [Chthoniobacterales bacterium]